MTDVKGFPNIGNSCYLDSVLFCLFLTENPFIQKHILNVKKTYVECQNKQFEKSLLNDFKKSFKLIIKSFQEGGIEQTCQPLKNLISKYRKHCQTLKIYPNFSNGSQHDASEFLQFLFTIFGLNGQKNVGTHIEYWKRYGVFTKTHKNVRWFKPFIRNDKKASIIHFVEHDKFKSSKSINKYLTIDEKVFDIDATYKKCFVNCSEEKISIVRFSDLFVFVLGRGSPITEKINHTKITINKTLTDVDGKTVYIDGIIIHLGEDISSGHYIVFKKYKNKWLLYDDLKSSIKQFESWKEVIKYHNNLVSTHGILYFYKTEI